MNKSWCTTGKNTPVLGSVTGTQLKKILSFLFSICLLHSEMNSTISHSGMLSIWKQQTLYWKILNTFDRFSPNRYKMDLLQILCINLMICLWIFFPDKNSAVLFCNFNFPQNQWVQFQLTNMLYNFKLLKNEYTKYVYSLSDLTVTGY